MTMMMIHPFRVLTVYQDLPDDVSPVLRAVLHQPLPDPSGVVHLPAGLGGGGGATTATRSGHAIGYTCTKFSIYYTNTRPNLACQALAATHPAQPKPHP